MINQPLRSQPVQHTQRITPIFRGIHQARLSQNTIGEMLDHQLVWVGGGKFALLKGRASLDEQRGGIVTPGGEGLGCGDGSVGADYLNDLVFGGDGTVLRAARALSGDRDPVASELEVAVLARSSGRRAFRRIDDSEMAAALGQQD